MRITEFFDNDFMQGLSKKPLNENLDNFLKSTKEKAQELLDRAQSPNEDKDKLTSDIKEFINSIFHTFISIRTIMSADIHIRSGNAKADDVDDFGKLIGSFYQILSAGSDEDVKDTMKRFYDKYSSDTGNKLSGTFANFQRALERETKLIDRPTKTYGVGAVRLVLDGIKVVEEVAHEFFKDHNPANPKNNVQAQTQVKEAIEVFFSEVERLDEMGVMDFGNVLLESEQEEKPFYAIVPAVIEVDGKKHRNIKSVAVARAKTAIDALREIRRNVKASVSAINKAAKKDKVKVVFNSDSDLKIMSYDEIKKKNIDNLVGSSLVSKGIIVLKGATEHGNVGSTALYAPMGHTFLNKSSVTRYLNKGQ